MNEDRILLAEALLREAVFASRRGSALPGGPPSSCGLGERHPTEPQFGDRGRELFARLFGKSPRDPASEAVHAIVQEWVARQDAFDRKRNHFLKDYRGRHGFDRSSYSPEALAGYDAGLARINEEEDAARRSAAERVVRTAG